MLRQKKEMAREYKFGLMAVGMKVIGKGTKPMEKED
jgi:hypothetical protein